MPRDLKGEWLAALATIALLAFGVTFGLLLSVSDSESEPTEIVENSNVNDATRTPPEEAEATITVDPTVTNTATDEPTNTFEPTEIIRPTRTEIPTRTPTEEARATNTTEPTIILRPTRTEIPTRTATHEPEITNTSTPTVIVRPTRTAIPTRTPTATNYVIVTLDFGILPTPTPDSTEVAVFETEQANCGRPQGWVVYDVQPGDTLFLISLAVNSTVDVLSTVNCLDDPARITAGDRLFLPTHPRGNVGGVVGVSAVGCSNPAARITNPLAAQRVASGQVTVTGSAYLENLSFYKLEIRRDGVETYNFLMSSPERILDGTLGVIDLSVFDTGVYWLKLTLVDNTGNIPEGLTCAIPMLIE